MYFVDTQEVARKYARACDDNLSFCARMGPFV